MTKLLLVRGHGLIAALIRWQTWGKYSHAAIQLDDWIYESVPGTGVRRIHRLHYQWDGVAVFDFVPPVTITNELYLRRFLEAQLGKRYDWLGVLRFIPRWKKPLDDKWFCSELVYAGLQQSGYNLFRRIDGVKVSPSMLSYSPWLNKNV